MKNEEAIACIRDFNRFYTNVVGLLDKHILKSAYSLSEARILFEINQRGQCTARQIKENLSMDEGYLSRIINKFVTTRLVEKKRSATDRRAFFLSLTDKGRGEFGKLNQASHEEIATLVTQLTAEELQLLVTQMKSIKTLLSKSL